MKKLRNSSYLIFVITVLSLTGCDSLCKKNVEDFAIVQNMTGRQFEITVCKGSVYGEATATIPSDSQLNEVSFGTHADSEVRGGPGGCSGVKDSRSAVGIALTPASFGQMKLCKDQASETYVIVENFQSCPTNFIEQIAAQSCPNN